MTPLDGWDISADHAVPSTVGQSFAGFRACLGTTSDADLAVDQAQSYFPQIAETKSEAPDIVTMDYCFLAGPGRNEPMAAQMAFYASQHKAEMSCLDWEGDSYTLNGHVVDNGTQPFSQVLAGIAAARKLGLDPGLYASEWLFDSARLAALRSIKVPWIWPAMYPGPLPASILNCGIPVIHQYVGTGVDRSHAFMDLPTLHKLAGRGVVAPTKLVWTVSPVGAAVTVAPNAAFYSISAPTPTVVYSHNGPTPQTFDAPLVAPGWTCILDGGTPCAVKNADLAKGS